VKIPTSIYGAHAISVCRYADPRQLVFTALVSDPTILMVALSSQYTPTHHTLSYSVLVQETGSIQGQWSPGHVALSASLAFKVL